MFKSFLSKFVTVTKVILVTFILSLLIDFFLGNKILEITDPIWKKTNFYERLIRIDHPVYHHGLKANIKHDKTLGLNGYYDLCTDQSGFRISCEADQSQNKNYDYGFIGDSFVEGVSLNYEETFVGIFDNTLRNKKVANLGVVSYAPKIYLAKLNYLINQGYKFKHIIVGIDISDLYDDDVFYTLDQNLNVAENYSKEKKLKLRKFLRKNFPFTNYYMFVIKKFGDYQVPNGVIKEGTPQFNDKAVMKASWTYSNPDEVIEGYISKRKEAQLNMVNTMNELYKLLEANNIKLSVLIYPWPQQLENDNVNSPQVNMWQAFCEGKCVNFINLFPSFFDEIKKNNYLETYKKYYLWNDTHFNKAGNSLLAEKLLEKFN